MRTIPQKLRDEISVSGINHRCALQGKGFGLCSSKVEWHHVWIYAGRQINEKWAIVGACQTHHEDVKKNKQIKEAFERESLKRATDEDFKKYPKVDWKKKKLALLKNTPISRYIRS